MSVTGTQYFQALAGNQLLPSDSDDCRGTRSLDDIGATVATLAEPRRPRVRRAALFAVLLGAAQIRGRPLDRR